MNSASSIDSNSLITSARIGLADSAEVFIFLCVKSSGEYAGRAAKKSI